MVAGGNGSALRYQHSGDIFLLAAVSAGTQFEGAATKFTSGPILTLAARDAKMRNLVALEMPLLPLPALSQAAED